MLLNVSVSISTISICVKRALCIAWLGYSCSLSADFNLLESSTTLRAHLGSLYSEFPWSSQVRDPDRTEMEMHYVSDFEPMSQLSLNDLNHILNNQDVIAQIGGMGSAKPNSSDPNLVNEAFATYIDEILADNGAAWRNVVYQRALEVAGVSERDYSFFWQVGNEISAPSYSSNIQKYFEGNTEANDYGAEIVPVYVEYFLAPTIAGFRQAATELDTNIRVALGSIAGFSNPNSTVFLDTLLNYEIVGEFAPSLTGFKVFELVDIITVHYLMNGSSIDDSDYWRAILENVRDNWLGQGRISGVWSTEEVGIRTAEGGAGAGSAIRIASRYLDWVLSNHFNGTQVKWFNYGTNVGPAGQTINDGLSALFDLVGDHSLFLKTRDFDTTSSIETYSFFIPELNGTLVTATSFIDDNLISELAVIPDTSAADSIDTSRLFSSTGAVDINMSLETSGSGAKILFDQKISLERGDSFLIWIQHLGTPDGDPVFKDGFE